MESENLKWEIVERGLAHGLQSKQAGVWKWGTFQLLNKAAMMNHMLGSITV